MNQPDACIVRITDSEGNTRGTGFLVSSDGLIATCAHVVEETKEPHVAFPGREPQPAQDVSSDDAHDVAFLRLTTPLPEGVAVAQFTTSIGKQGAAVRAFGYPKVGEIEGLWGHGQLVGPVRECGRSLLQLSSTQITKGFSGGPVWEASTGQVIGIVTKFAAPDRYERLGNVAFAIPAETLRDLCPEELILRYRLPGGIPFQTPRVPRYFVPRPEVSNKLKAQLLADEATAPGALVVSAVHGLGGVGKTTLVAALAHDPEVQAHFPDGVLWITLGREPDISANLVNWITNALRDYSYRCTTNEAASSHLRTLLHDKACLVVLDDVWQADHLSPFLVGGERCQVLITTRDATLGRKLGDRLYDLDVMTEAQALALFEARLGALGGGDRELAAGLARELDYLPLALELAAAQIRHDLSWTELREVLRNTLTELASLDLDEVTYRNKAQHLFLRLNLERLAPGDQEAFAWLGVLPEDTHLTPSMAATIWVQPEVDARRQLRRLRDRALIHLIDKDQYAIHDLLHDEARSRLIEHMSLPQAHGVLLTRYRARTSNGLWHTLPDDGYIHERLVWHLQQAGQTEAIHALLQEETEEGRNGWHQARDRLGQQAGYAADLTHAWCLAEEEFALRATDLGIARQCRYALIASSLSSLAGNVPPTLLTALVRAGVWTPIQGLTCARQAPEPRQRALSLCRIAQDFPIWRKEQILEEALEAARRGSRSSDRAKTLAEIATHLPVSLGDEVQQEALSAVAELSDLDDQLRALISVSPDLSEPLKTEVLQYVLVAVRDGDGGPLEAAMLSEMAAHLPESLIGEALECAQGIDDVRWQSRCMGNLACRLAELGCPEEALANVSKLPNGPRYLRFRALTSLVPFLQAPLREKVTRELQAMLRGVLDPMWWIINKPDLTSSDSWLDTLFLGMLVGLLSLLWPRWRSLAWGKHLSQFPQEARAVLLKESLDNLDRSSAESRIAELLALISLTEGGDVDDLLHQALRVLQGMEEGEQARSLEKWASYVAKSEHAQTYLREALNWTQNIGGASDWVRAEAGMASYLPEELRDQAVQRVLMALPELGSEWKARALSNLAPVLPNSLLRMVMALRTVEAIRWHRPKLEAVSALTLMLATRRTLLLKVGLRRTLTLAFESWPTRSDGFSALIRLVPHLAKRERVRVLQSALALARQLRDADDQCRALAQVAPYLSPPLQLEVCAEALASVRLIKDRGDRCRALVEMSSRLSGDLWRAAIQEALVAIQEIREVTPELDLPVVSSVTTQDSGWGELCRAAVATTRSIDDPANRAQALTQLIPSLDGPLLGVTIRGALATTRRVDDDLKRTQLLSELVPSLLQLPAEDLYHLWKETLRSRAMHTRKALFSDLGVLAAILARLGGPGAVANTYCAVQEVCRWWP